MVEYQNDGPSYSPQGVIVEAKGNPLLTVPGYTDSCGLPTLSTNFVSGSTLSVGTYGVDFTATDAYGAAATCRYSLPFHSSSRSFSLIVDLFQQFSGFCC